MCRSRACRIGTSPIPARSITPTFWTCWTRPAMPAGSAANMVRRPAPLPALPGRVAGALLRAGSVPRGRDARQLLRAGHRLGEAVVVLPDINAPQIVAAQVDDLVLLQRQTRAVGRAMGLHRRHLLGHARVVGGVTPH